MKSSEEKIEHYQEELATAEGLANTGYPVIKIGLTHIRMGEVRQGLREVWSGIHVRSTPENIAIAALTLGTLINPGAGLEE